MGEKMLTENNKKTISDCLSNIAQTLPGFQPRYGQRKMIAEVAKAFSRTEEMNKNSSQGESILIIEGPTGTGKSLAYLLPAIVMAKALGKKLVVSSATVALQEQLANNDIPFLAKHAGIKVSYTIAKGRGRYICTQRLYQQLGYDALDGEQVDFLNEANSDNIPLKSNSIIFNKLKKLAQSLETKKWSGDRDVLEDAIADNVWSQLTNDRHGCVRNQCSYFSKCPFFSARKQLEEVDIIVANHDLLLSDIAMGGGMILPEPADTLYCIDEAHHLADKAVKQFAAYHTLNGTINWLERIKSTLNRATIIAKDHHQAEQIEKIAEEIVMYLIDLRIILANMSELIPGREKYSTESILRFAHGLLPEGLISISANLASTTKSLKTQLYLFTENIKKKVAERTTEEAKMCEKVLAELGFFTGRVDNLVAVWQLMTSINSNDVPPIAKWISAEYINKTHEVEYTLHASPVSASDILSEKLWKRVAGAVLTSATLRSLNSFDLLLAATGLNHFVAVTCIALASPFNLSEQARLIIPSMKFDPKDSSNHTQEITSLLPKLIKIEGGNGTLVLFSSKKQMREVADNLPESIKDLLLIQSDRSKELLLREHFSRISNELPSILFGLASFAEGLDLPGKACNHVIIAKLPFDAPDDPVDQTLAEWVEHRGGNPFFEITLPKASIKLIQAVGRLIRSETDTGTITILDTRLKTKSYGKLILKSLPPFRVEI
jgi:ATP-dependent DNA helicase DinG